MAQDYNNTLNLLKTDFPMRAALPQREPETMENWEKNRIYYKIVEKNEGKPKYVLHDGPPYANGDIHLGTALNKVLKDIIIKYKNMSGYNSPYVPGWDTHGLPTELKAIKQIGFSDKGALSPLEIRKKCRDFAMMYVESQKAQFKRLGVLGDFDDPYITLKPEFEAKQVEVFGAMAQKGYVYKGLKPVYWCPSCQTALAEAEIEYEEDPCFSIYVKFKIADDKGKLSGKGINLDKTYFVIWTTTTWTLPGNNAICIGPDYNYSVVKAGEEYYIVAEEMIDSAMKAAKISEYEKVLTMPGREFERMTYRHPFIDRESMIILGSHVTLESGTGCVHTAPGHGVEDFEVCVNNYPEIEILVPVDSEGKMTAQAGQFEGMTTNDCSKAIAKLLDETGYLFAMEKIIHQYPHCWRCKEPIIFRATEQWFCSVEGFKEDAIEAVKKVQWIPEWGEDRITAMIRDRSDWCISRQRTWGVPIPIFYCKKCGKAIVNDTTIKAVSELFREKGSDAWFAMEAGEILPAGFACDECGATEFTKEKDILDVWFDSGVTHAAVCMGREDLHWPADLYLEGNDQYRGWFQSSLLTAVAWKGEPPYKAVCTHGWVVDGEGRKMSKSLGNGIDPNDVIKEYGADILRLWVASSDYHADVRISKDLLKQLSEAYRKIRNTQRFILGNISDFDPNKDMVSDDQLEEIDKWALAALSQLVDKATEAYEAFDYHVVYHSVHNFCTVDMSNFYLDILKDRLYVEKADSVSRRAAQTTIYKILKTLTLLIAPALSFTAEEVWKYIPKTEGDDAESIFLNEIPKAAHIEYDAQFMSKWERIRELRDIANRALEDARGAKIIGKSLEAKVILKCGGENLSFAKSVESELAAAFIVSAVEIEDNGSDSEIAAEIKVADGGKCERCWVYSDTVGKDEKHPTLCARCAKIIG